MASQRLGDGWVMAVPEEMGVPMAGDGWVMAVPEEVGVRCPNSPKVGGCPNVRGGCPNGCPKVGVPKLGCRGALSCRVLKMRAWKRCAAASR